MKIQQARNLLSADCSNFDLERLQKYHVKLMDAWRESRADYGYPQAVNNGFYSVISSESASGFTPVDVWLEHNLTVKLQETEALLEKFYKNCNEQGISF